MWEVGNSIFEQKGNKVRTSVQEINRTLLCKMDYGGMRPEVGIPFISIHEFIQQIFTEQL